MQCASKIISLISTLEIWIIESVGHCILRNETKHWQIWYTYVHIISRLSYLALQYFTLIFYHCNSNNQSIIWIISITHVHCTHRVNHSRIQCTNRMYVECPNPRDHIVNDSTIEYYVWHSSLVNIYYTTHILLIHLTICNLCTTHI